MALWTILKLALGFFFGYLLFITLGPVVYQTRYENASWDDMPVWLQAHGDQIYGIWILVIVVVAAVLIFAGISEARRNRNVEAQ